MKPKPSADLLAYSPGYDPEDDDDIADEDDDDDVDDDEDADLDDEWGDDIADADDLLASLRCECGARPTWRRALVPTGEDVEPGEYTGPLRRIWVADYGQCQVKPAYFDTHLVGRDTRGNLVTRVIDAKDIVLLDERVDQVEFESWDRWIRDVRYDA